MQKGWAAIGPREGNLDLLLNLVSNNGSHCVSGDLRHHPSHLIQPLEGEGRIGVAFLVGRWGWWWRRQIQGFGLGVFISHGSLSRVPSWRHGSAFS